MLPLLFLLLLHSITLPIHFNPELCTREGKIFPYFFPSFSPPPSSLLCLLLVPLLPSLTASFLTLSLISPAAAPSFSFNFPLLIHVHLHLFFLLLLLPLNHSIPLYLHFLLHLLLSLPSASTLFLTLYPSIQYPPATLLLTLLKKRIAHLTFSLRKFPR